MNSNRRVFLFVVYSASLFLLFSLLSLFFRWQWQPLQRINLIANIIKKDTLQQVLTDLPGPADTIVIKPKPAQDFNLYRRPHYITSFHADTSHATLAHFLPKLAALKKGKKQKIRIAYFGDSMIENDLLTQTLRKRLQEYFGGEGVGFIPINAVGHKIRQTVEHDYSGGWDDENLRNAKDKRHLYLSGHIFSSDGDWVQVADKTITDSSFITEKSLLCGYADKPVTIQVNDHPFVVQARQSFNRIVLATDPSRKIRIAVSDNTLPVFGISFEPLSGVVVDNFSFRGVRGDEYRDLDTGFLRTIAANNPYDLIIFQYGVNVLFRPDDRNFSWYARMLMPVVQKFRRCFPNADFIMSSTADRAFRYDNSYRSAVGIDTLVKIQAEIAYGTGSHFYNLFETMGGRNSIVDWASRTPSLANKDHVHPNSNGAALLGNYFFDAIMREYNKYTDGRP